MWGHSIGRRFMGKRCSAAPALLFALLSAGAQARTPTPPDPHESCIRAAAAYYHAPDDPVSVLGMADLITAFMRAERTCGRVHENANGSFDYGCMGINSIHLKELAQYGITARRLVADDCLNIYVGTWIFKRELVREPNLWKAIGNYNSHTPHWNARYQLLVWDNLRRIWSQRVTAR